MSDQKGAESIIAMLATQARAKAQQDKDDAVIKVYGQLYDKASAYTNLLVALGYGGFFAIWSTTKTYLTKKEMLISGLAVLFSLFWFIAWQVFVMISSAKDLLGYEDLVNASVDEFQKVKAAEDLREAKRKYRLRHYWIANLILTGIPGFAGGLFLMYAFVRHLVSRSFLTAF